MGKPGEVRLFVLCLVCKNAPNTALQKTWQVRVAPGTLRAMKESSRRVGALVFLGKSKLCGYAMATLS